MFPHITDQQRDNTPLRELLVLFRLENHQLIALRLPGQHGPTTAFDGDRGSSVLLLESLKRAKILLDLLGGGPFGGSILALLAATFVASLLGGGLFRDRLLLPLVTAVAGTFAYNGVYLILLRIFGVPVNLVDALVQVILPSALINMLASPIVARLMLALHRRVKPIGATW